MPLNNTEYTVLRWLLEMGSPFLRDSPEPLEGEAVCRAKAVPSSLHCSDPEYWSGPGDQTGGLLLYSRALYFPASRGLFTLVFGWEEKRPLLAGMIFTY